MRSICVLLCTILLGSCMGGVGPRNLKIDSVKYNHAVQNSNDTQLLLNMVRLRYRDTPTFITVGTISASYEWKRSLGAEFRTKAGDEEKKDDLNFFDDNVFKVGADYTERPTAVYQPLRGEGFAKEFLAPISLQALVLINSSGWRIDRLLRCCVQRMNGIRNAPTASGPTPRNTPVYQEFKELMDVFAELEKNDAINILVEKHAVTNRKEFVLVIDSELADPFLVHKIWQMLDLSQGAYHIRLSPYHGQKHAGDEVLLDNRSPLSILYYLSQGVHVPPEDEGAGKVMVTRDKQGNRLDWDDVLGGVMNVYYVPKECLNSGYGCYQKAVAVNYRGHTFYIDDSDLDSKATFALISQMMTLQTGCVQVPALTLPIGFP